MQTYLQKLEAIAVLQPDVVHVISGKLCMSETETNRYIAFCYAKASEQNVKLFYDDLVVLPLGVVGGTEQYCLFEPNPESDSPRRWRLTFAGNTEEVRERAGKRLDGTLPGYTKVDYDLHLIEFAYVRPTIYNCLQGQFANGRSAKQNVEELFHDRYKTGLIIETSSDGYENAAFSVGRYQDGTHMYAVFSPNWNPGYQRWHCAGFFTRETMYGFTNVDFVGYEHTVEDEGNLFVLRHPEPERQPEHDEAEDETPKENTQKVVPEVLQTALSTDRRKVFLIYGMDTFTGQMPGEIAMLEKWLRENQMEPVKVSPEEDHGGMVILDAIENRVAKCSFALCLFTPVDRVIQWDEDAEGEPMQKRIWNARPNVVFEAGYCIAKFGRKRVRFLTPAPSRRVLTMPSDIASVSRVVMDKNDKWKEILLIAINDAEKPDEND